MPKRLPKRLTDICDQVKNNFLMGFSFFKTLTEVNNTTYLSIPFLPVVSEGELFTHTKIRKTIISQVKENQHASVIDDEMDSIDSSDEISGNDNDDGGNAYMMNITDIKSLTIFIEDVCFLNII